MIYSDDEDPSTEEGIDYGGFQAKGRDGVVFAVDCCKEMFHASDEDDQSPFSQVISAVHEMLLNKVISSDKDMHAIVFFGTTKSNNPGDFKHIYVWQDFDVPCVKTIKQLRDMQTTDFKSFCDDFGSDCDCQIEDVLWTCLNLFRSSSNKLADKTLVLFPWKDNPHAGDSNACVRARTKASDLHDYQVDVQITSFNKNFMNDKFYKDILTDPDGVDERNGNPLQYVSNLYNFLLKKCYKQRPISRNRKTVILHGLIDVSAATHRVTFVEHDDLFARRAGFWQMDELGPIGFSAQGGPALRVPVHICDGFEMTVSIHTVARRATRTNAVWLDSTSNEETKLRTNYVNSNTGEILMPSDMKLKQTWGGMDIVFEKEDVEKMRKIRRSGFTLVGFKPISSIKFQHHVHTAQFIYPDEESTKGSTPLFSALLSKCLDRRAMAICCYVPRGSSSPKLVALLPQASQIDEKSLTTINSPGFYVIFLPYADDLRHIDINKNAAQATSEQVASAEAIIKRLRFSYEPENFDNPALQTHYKNLEAMALEQAASESVDDHTVADTERINRKTSQLIEEFKSTVYPAGYDPANKPCKRKAPTVDNSSKKSKDIGEIDVRRCIAEKTLGKLTVADLKDICKNNRISGKGKKAEIVAAITDHFKA